MVESPSTKAYIMTIEDNRRGGESGIYVGIHGGSIPFRLWLMLVVLTPALPAYRSFVLCISASAAGLLLGFTVDRSTLVEKLAADLDFVVTSLDSVSTSDGRLAYVALFLSSRPWQYPCCWDQNHPALIWLLAATSYSGNAPVNYINTCL